jgi:Tfp pilus assembly protein PilF
MNDQHDSHPQTPHLVAYLATLSLLLLASFFPEARLWGLSGWFVFSLPVRLILFGLGLVPAGAMLWASSRTDAGGRKSSSHGYAVVVIALALCAGALFYTLSGETHFLGDGYLQLGTLAGDHPLLKPRDYGTMRVHVWVKQLHGGGGEDAARFSYRTISVVSGMLFVLISGLLARTLFARLRDRLLLVLGLCSAGYMLLFFGYVENYALLCLSVLLFVWIGLQAARGRVSGWNILFPLALAILFHAVGLVLVPAALYVLVTRTSLGARLRATGRWPIATLAGLLTVAGAVLFGYLYSTSYYFRFAFIPIVSDRFTVDGYTLFSLPHLIDYANQLWLLLPALLLLIVLLVQVGRAALRRAPEYRFLLGLLATTLAGGFILDPKFGMARDWDLFSFPGVVLAAFFYVLLLDPKSGVRRRAWVAGLGISLGLLSLLPRAVVQHVPSKGVELYRSYLERDPKRNQTGLYLLAQHYHAVGDSAGLAWADQYRKSKFPEADLSDRVERLLQQGEITKARRLCKTLIETRPRLRAGWFYMGEIYHRLNKHDSAVAVLEIVNGLNPYSPSVLNPLGRSYFFAGDTAAAERAWLRSAEIDPDNYVPFMSLGGLYRSRGDADRYVSYLETASAKRGAPARISLDLAEYYAFKREYRTAAGWFVRAVERGVDSALAERLLDNHPPLRERLGR